MVPATKTMVVSSRKAAIEVDPDPMMDRVVRTRTTMTNVVSESEREVVTNWKADCLPSPRNELRETLRIHANRH